MISRFDGRRLVEELVIGIAQRDYSGPAYRFEMPGHHPLVLDEILVGSTDEGPAR